MGNKKEKNKVRYNISTVIVYIIGIVLLAQLFNLQIVHGEEYRESSNTRLTRESVLEADRGNITDSSGTLLATVETQNIVELYKTKSDNNTLNNTILRLINLLSTNGDRYVDNFLLNIEPYSFKLNSEQAQKEWKKANNINEDATAEDVFNYFKEKYGIKTENVQDARKTLRSSLSRKLKTASPPTRACA